MKSQKKTPKRRDKEKSRQKLLSAGIDMFSKYGFESATTKQIAKKADINEVMIARYFKNKAGLLRAILVELVEGAKAESNARPIAELLEDEITLLMREKCKGYLAQRDLHKISMSRLLIHSKLNEEIHKFVFPVAEETIARRLQVFQDRGQIHIDHNLSLLAKMVQFECVGILTMMCIQKRTDEKTVFNVIDSFGPILAHGFRLSPRPTLNLK